MRERRRACVRTPTPGEANHRIYNEYLRSLRVIICTGTTRIDVRGMYVRGLQAVDFTSDSDGGHRKVILIVVISARGILPTSYDSISTRYHVCTNAGTVAMLVTSATMTPRDASMATRPCLISASRHLLMSPGAAPSDNWSGSNICGRQIDHERSVCQKIRYCTSDVCWDVYKQVNRVLNTD